MSLLDEEFGEREKPELPPRRSGDELLAAAMQSENRWKCEDRIRLTLDAFFECWPELLPRSSALRQQHYAAARQLVDELGEAEAPAFVRWAETMMRPQNGPPELIVKSCRSLVFLLGKWREREKPDPAKWWTAPCPKCFTFHHPDSPCHGEEDEDGKA